MDRWIDETLYPGWGQRLKVSRLLHEEKTSLQHLVIFENEMLGRCFMLDGCVQVTMADEFIYHEMMVHVPLLALGEARDVLVIGGGDGGILREVLKHQSVKRAILCEIDRSVVDMAQKWFPELSAGAFQSKRVDVVIGDGVKYVAETRKKFDAVIVDSTDPHGPGAVLFTKSFYADCKRCLKPGGVLVTQNGVPFMQPEELRQSVGHFRELFADGGCYLATIPTYAGGPMAMGWASDDKKLRKVSLKMLRERYAAAGLAARYYTPETHLAAFALPEYVAILL